MRMWSCLLVAGIVSSLCVNGYCSFAPTQYYHQETRRADTAAGAGTVQEHTSKTVIDNNKDQVKYIERDRQGQNAWSRASNEQTSVDNRLGPYGAPRPIERTIVEKSVRYQPAPPAPPVVRPPVTAVSEREIVQTTGAQAGSYNGYGNRGFGLGDQGYWSQERSDQAAASAGSQTYNRETTTYTGPYNQKPADVFVNRIRTVGGPIDQPIRAAPSQPLNVAACPPYPSSVSRYEEYSSAASDANTSQGSSLATDNGSRTMNTWQNAGATSKTDHGTSRTEINPANYGNNGYY